MNKEIFSSQKRIVYKNNYGGISIFCPCENLCLYDAIDSIPKGVKYKIVDLSDIPTDRTFRDAWELSDD